MRYAILGDIHSNLEALQAVVREAHKLKVNRFVSVGDIVGYGPNPQECMDLLESLPCMSVAGNHDQAVAGVTDFSGFRKEAQDGILWTRENCDAAHIQQLESLPLVYEGSDLSVVHASLFQPDQWEYVLSKYQAFVSMGCQKGLVCFYGHTHLPVIFRSDGEIFPLIGDPITLSGGYRYFVNAGSVGQPRDANPCACLLIFDAKALTLEMHRVAYDIAETQKKIRQAGLPEVLAVRLTYGR